MLHIYNRPNNETVLHMEMIIEEISTSTSELLQKIW